MLEHQSMVFSIALRILGDRSAAEEAAQDVFIELHAKLGALASDQHVLYWLRRVTVHRSIDLVRRRQRRPEVAMDWNEYGPGESGGYGGGIYHVGGGVVAPQLIFAPDPEFSDEARRAKFQGVCVVSLVVDAQGNPQRVQVLRHLGMGLDQKAVDAVKQYRFKPATLQGKPVPVEVNIEVTFRIY
jgi:TonB family protein